LVFVLVGSFFVYLGFLKPIWEFLECRSWKGTDCTVRSSHLQVHGKGSDKTYSIEVTFEYTVAGHRYEADRYSFHEGSTSWGKEDMRAEVARLSPGTVTGCYYDPEEPGRAVISRDIQLLRTLLCLLPLLFVIAGLKLIAEALGIHRAVTPGAPTKVVRGPQPPKRERWHLRFAADGGVRLRPRGSRRVRAVVAAVLLAIAVLFAWLLPSSEIGLGAAAWLVNVGAWILVAVAFVWFSHAALRALAPRLQVTLAQTAMRPGERAALTWRVRGLARWIASLRINLEGREEIGFAGRLSPSRSNTFYSQEVAVRTTASIRENRATLEIPSGAMHSFSGEHNRVVWLVRIEGDVADWPDIDEEFEVQVLPEVLE